MTRRRRFAGLGGAVAALLVVPLTTSTSLAAWNDAEWLRTPALTTTTVDCSAESGLVAEASARQVGGTLLGTDLASLAEVQGVGNGVDGDGIEWWEPSSAHDLDPAGTTTHTRSTSLSVAALSGVPLVSLPTLNAAVPGISAGALAQYSQVTAAGAAIGATGLVADRSGVITIGPYDATPPASSAISLSGVVPAIAGVADATLTTGAVSAVSQVDGCALLASELWGVGTDEGTVRREYDIAGLGLTASAPALADLVPAVNGAVTTLGTTVGGLSSGLTGALGSTLTTALNALNLNLLVGRVSVKSSSAPAVVLTPPDFSAASALLGETRDSASVLSLNPGGGTVSADLAALLGDDEDGLNGLPPNTLIDGAELAALSARTTGFADDWIVAVQDALTSAVAQTGLRITQTLTLQACLLGTCVDVATIGIDVRGTLGALAGNDTTLASQITITALGGVNISSLLSPLTNTIVGAISAVLDSTLASASATITALGPTLDAILSPVAIGVGGLLTALAPIISLQVNLQPDVTAPNPPPADAPSYRPATSTATAEYLVTALRIGLLSDARLTSLSLATATAGPVSLGSEG
ncbi:choice-of-anchor G family protein [Microbacterium marinilacus]|uniref:Choice-of-anchor G family protein n=1 Tax=Microbacterium marinilacus TaxID=415209 RepID=A0ABP7B9Y1_9MICO|nr:choice-of-anchor G family protein [Microbacterium marinilacus]MBY0687049.1 choice-of-anchor G family protein [Microbacterium marinilacus]